MARADLLVNLVKAGSKGDQSIFQENYRKYHRRGTG